MHVVFSPVSDDELQRLSELNPGWHFERDDAGATIPDGFVLDADAISDA